MCKGHHATLHTECIHRLTEQPHSVTTWDTKQGFLAARKRAHLLKALPEVDKELRFPGDLCVLHGRKHAGHLLLLWCEVHRQVVIQQPDAVWL